MDVSHGSVGQHDSELDDVVASFAARPSGRIRAPYPGSSGWSRCNTVLAARRLLLRLEAPNPKFSSDQLDAPRGVEGPAAGVAQPLRFRQIAC